MGGVMAQGKKTIIDYGKVEEYAMFGLNDKDIATLLDICPQTLSRLKSQDTELANAIKRGRLRAQVSVTKALYDAALKGNTIACIFWLCNRAPEEWRNVNKIDANLTGDFPQIEIVRVRDDSSSVNTE
jgi:hypothetical protein